MRAGLTYLLLLLATVPGAVSATADTAQTLTW